MHLWADNPAFREISGKFPMGWVLESSDGAIAGYLGNVPLNYELEGRRLLAATTRAWVVDTPYRSYSPLLLATYFQQSDVELFLSTTINAQSAPAYNAFQSSRVPIGQWDSALFWVTHYPGFTASFLRKKHVLWPDALGYPLSAAVLLGDRLKGSNLWSGRDALKVQPCASFDQRFDAFWLSLRKKKSNILLGVRTQESLAWHFKFALLNNRAWIYTVGNASELSAYAVFVRHDYRDIGLTRMRLADFQCLDPDRAPELLPTLLRAAAVRCRQDSIHMIEVVGFSPLLQRILKPFCPHQRALTSWLYSYKAGNSSLAEKLKSAEVWEPSLFDGDSSL